MAEHYYKYWPMTNTSLLLHSRWPRFTDCFQHTVLVYIPCALLWLPLPCYLRSLARKRRDENLQLSELSATRMFKVICMAAIHVLFIIDDVRHGRRIAPAEFLANGLRALTFAMMGWVTKCERESHVRSSGRAVVPLVAFILSDLVPLYSKIMTQTYNVDFLKFCLFIVNYVLQLCLFFLFSVADNKGRADPQSQASPEKRASFISKVFYTWVSGIVYRGCKRELTEEDLFHLLPRDSSNKLAPVFEKLWNSEVNRLRRCERNGHNQDMRTAQQTMPQLPSQFFSQMDERQTMINSGDFMEAMQYGALGSEPAAAAVSQISKANEKKKNEETNPSLLRVLAHLNFHRLSVGFLQKVMAEVFNMTGPIWLSLLVSNADHPDDASAVKGYGLTGLLFVSCILKSVLGNSCFWTSQVAGIQTKAMLISAIYKKALTMSHEARSKFTLEELVKVMSVDVQHVQDVVILIFHAWATPLQIIAVVAILFQYIGVAVFAGLAILLLTVPVNMAIARTQRRLQREKLKVKGDRLRLTKDAVSGMKVLKLNAWEPAFMDKINNIRNQETRLLFKIAFTSALSSVVFHFSHYLVTLASLATYVNMADDHVLDSQTAFVTLTFFSLLTIPLQVLASIITWSVQARISIGKIKAFLCCDNLDPNNVIRNSSALYAVAMDNGTFTWKYELPPVIRRISLSIPEGQVVAVVGPAGSGKSSLMSAFLGEMNRISGTVTIKGTVAYVPQQAWIQNGSVKENILFGQAYDEKRYQEVIQACALEGDLEVLSAGDLTEIGERGITLTSGQKQRVNLARAVYRDADVYLLDDPLGALDGHVAQHVFALAISKQGLLREKTRILVTNESQWLPQMDNVLFMVNGRVSEAGTYDELMASGGDFGAFNGMYLHDGRGVAQMQNQLNLEAYSGTRDDATAVDDFDFQTRKPIARKRRVALTSYELSALQPLLTQSEVTVYDEEEADVVTGRLMQVESKEERRFKWSVLAKYLKAGGCAPLLVCLVLFVAIQVASALANFWLARWSADNVLKDGRFRELSEFRDLQKFYLGVFGAFGFAQVCFFAIFNAIYWIRMVTAAQKLHLSALDSVFKSPMAFFDTTPLGCIMNRFSRDLEVVDFHLPIILRDFLSSLTMTLVTLVVISVATPLFLALAILLVIVYLFLQHMYVPTARQLQHMESVTRWPVYSHFSETIVGGPTIRCYGAADRFVTESQQRVDRNQSLYYIGVVTSRWLGMWLGILSDLIILGAALFAVITPGTSGADVGLSVSYAIQMSLNLVWLVRQTSQLQTNIASVDRLQEYSELPSEAAWKIPYSRPADEWPEYGRVEFQEYEARHRPGSDLVMKGVTCTFRAGEKIFIVGRAGAGKSTLALASFRLIEASHGGIFVDGLDISSIGLHDLRSCLTILPRNPMLFYGTLRMNLDPVGQFTDDQLWMALTCAHLKDFVEGLPGRLDFHVEEEGQSLSVGQRQLVCLARALLKKTRILFVDKATAVVDLETDRLIQDTIRTEFDQCTVISIAHRLNTVMDYDRILVLDSGLIKELDTPTNLLKDQNSFTL